MKQINCSSFFLITLLLIFTSCQQNNNTAQSIDEKGNMMQVDGKKPLILLTDRPPNLETPLKYFLQDFTPNDVFFVRWHLSNIPSKINADTFLLRIGGNVKRELALSLNDLKTKFKSYSINALCLCAGNARSCFNPRVAGAQWVNGGMGNAKWTGVKLKDIIEMAEAKPDSKFISFNGMDAPPLPSVPDFVKSLDLNHAIDGEVMIAYEMNNEPLPLLNGYPLKLVVPGWYATYWVGMLNEIKIYSDTFKGFWMDKAYLVPKGISNGNEKPDSLAKELVPINKIAIRSIFVSPEPDSILIQGKSYEIQGLAFDGGDGISKVEISLDSGKTWMATKLDSPLGKYSWRRWRFNFIPGSNPVYNFFVKATNSKGETQPWHQWNRSGYMKNEIESLTLHVIPKNSNADLIAANCVACHSLRYIEMQPDLPRAGWEKIVKKMVKTFGTPISDTLVVAQIIDYLYNVKGKK
jgi:sulfite dehydrogenase (cytochrome) subunit A